MKTISSKTSVHMGKVLVFLACAVLANGLMAAEWFVAKGGSDSNAGSEQAPFLTIQRAVNAASAGDTVNIGEGIFADGEYSAGETKNSHTNRVMITKPLTLKGSGKDKTFIQGAFDPDTGLRGPKAVRCVYVSPAGAGTVIRDLTLCGGAAEYDDAKNECADNYGGALHAGGILSNTIIKNVYLVDCVISNCAAFWGGGISGGTAVRCLFTKNIAQSHGGAARRSDLLNCLVVKNVARGTDEKRGIVGEQGTKIVNCTIAANIGAGLVNACEAYNCVIFGNYHGTYSNNKPTMTSCYNHTDNGNWLLFSPASGDYRVTAGTVAAGGGSAAYLSQITLPAGIEADIDYNGKRIDTSSGTIDAGCIQGAATPAGGRIVFNGGAFEVNGETNLFAHACCIFQSETWPVTVMARPYGATAAKPLISGYLDNNWRQVTGTIRWPKMDGVLPLVPPPVVGERMGITPHFADAVVWCDDDGDAATADGTEAHPFPVLQDAITFATNTYTSSQKILVLVKPGTYDQGTTFFAGMNCRLVIPDWHEFVVRSTDGPAVTTIKGVADNDGPYPSNYVGCGPNAVRGVAFASGSYNRHALQGFTIADGHSRVDNYKQDISSDRGGALYGAGLSDYHVVLDCVVTNCSAVRATMYGVWATRCSFYDCRGYGGVMRYTTLSGCFVHPSCQIGTGPSGSSANRVLGNETAAYLSTMPDCSLWGSRPYYNSLFGKVTVGADDILCGCAATNSAVANYTDTLGIVHVAHPGFVDPANGDWRLYGATPVRYATRLPEDGNPERGQWMTNFAAFVTTGLSGEGISTTDGKPLAGCHQSTVNNSLYIGADDGGISITGGANGYSPLPEPLSLTLERVVGTRPCIGYTVNGVTNLFDETPVRTFTDADANEYGLSIEVLYTHDWYVSPTGNNGDYGTTPATPFRTLAYAMTKAMSGDTVHAAEGVYSEGSAVYSSTASREHPSRVIVGERVTLLADGATENTIIVGESDTSKTANSYGMGTNAMRCVTLLDYAKIKGFTLTGGRTRYSDMGLGGSTMEWTSLGNWTGGGVQGTKDGRDRAFAVDCVISNCVALYGGGASMVNLVRCKVVNCRAVNNGGGANLVNMYGSLIDRCYSSGGGANISSFTRIYNSTIGPHGYNHNGTPRPTIATASSGVSCLINCLLLGSLGGANTITNPASYTVFADTCGNFPTNETSRVIPSADLVVDADLRPIPFRNAAVDTGSEAMLTDFSATDTAKRFLPYASDVDLSGAPRVTNGALDPGALEANWLPQYAKTLGGQNTKIVMDEAGSYVVDDGSGTIAIPGGESLSLTWGDGATRGAREGVVNVTGEGTLTMTLGGEPYATITAADSPYAFRFKPGSLSAFDFGFAFEGAGEASLSGFNLVRGTTLLFR